MRMTGLLSSRGEESGPWDVPSSEVCPSPLNCFSDAGFFVLCRGYNINGILFSAYASKRALRVCLHRSNPFHRLRRRRYFFRPSFRASSTRMTGLLSSPCEESGPWDVPSSEVCPSPLNCFAVAGFFVFTHLKSRSRVTKRKNPTH